MTLCETSFPFPFWAVELDDFGWSDSPGMVAGLAECLCFCCCFASLWLLDAASDGSSLVLDAEHVSFLKVRNDIPRDHITLSRIARVLSV